VLLLARRVIKQPAFPPALPLPRPFRRAEVEPVRLFTCALADGVSAQLFEELALSRIKRDERLGTLQLAVRQARLDVVDRKLLDAPSLSEAPSRT
jgi:hypothetical protein